MTRVIIHTCQFYEIGYPLPVYPDGPPKEAYPMTLDDRLTNYYRETVRVDGNTPNSRQRATQAILSDLLEIIGENMEQPRPLDEESKARFYRVGGQNFIKNELRDKVRKYCV